MFFVLSKTVAVLLVPSNILILAGLIGLALMATRWRRAGFRLAVASLALLLAIGILPVSHLLTSALENRFPAWDASRGAPDGIVVLGGAISSRLSMDRGAPQIPGAAGRIIAIAKLAREFPKTRIIYSGGNSSLPGGPPEAGFIYALLDDFGVPRERVVLELRSRNTAENALYSKQIADPKPGERWLLVTSAIHLPRAVGCFRRAGFPVEAYPVDWKTVKKIRFTLSLAPLDGLKGADDAMHEWVGLLTYRLTGRTSAFLPAP